MGDDWIGVHESSQRNEMKWNEHNMNMTDSNTTWNLTRLVQLLLVDINPLLRLARSLSLRHVLNTQNKNTVSLASYMSNQFFSKSIHTSIHGLWHSALHSKDISYASIEQKTPIGAGDMFGQYENPLTPYECGCFATFKTRRMPTHVVEKTVAWN